MSESNKFTSSSTSKDDGIPVKVISKPSNVINTFERTISVAGSSYAMTLVTMRRSFLLVIDNVKESLTKTPEWQGDAAMSSEMLIQNFMSGNSSLKGLSLAIGGHSTCLIASDNSVASLSLASRLSKNLNNNGPVYVANNMQAPSDTFDQQDYVTNLYEKVFQFVRHNYRGSQNVDNKSD